jgi:hypothetical protein
MLSLVLNTITFLCNILSNWAYKLLVKYTNKIDLIYTVISKVESAQDLI